MLEKLADLLKTFIHAIQCSRLAISGAILVTLVFPFLAAAVLYDSFLHLENPYFGGFIYMVLGPLFILGLILVFIGVFLARGQEEVRLFTLEYLRRQLADEGGYDRMRKMMFLVILLTGVNLVIVSVIAYSGYHYMESNAFCGEVCHVPMTPEYTAYQNSPHSRVDCVECHIGTGASWFVKSKLSGARQLYAVVADTFSRPIETPVHGLRPARDTCEQCHRPEKFHGDKLVIKDKFLEDENNTRVQTVLLMKIGSAGDLASSSHGIHWHVALENRIEYVAVDRERQVIPEVRLSRGGESPAIYRNADADQLIADAEEMQVREMDCIDCHNRPSHIYLPADQALDAKLLTGEISVELPFIKKQAMAIIGRDYATHEQARESIADELDDFYRKQYPDIYSTRSVELKRSIAGVQKAYTENVFPAMKIGWQTYASNIGHTYAQGCFRCHDEEHESEDGATISMDCETCHTILAEEEENPKILQTLLGI